MPIYKYRCDGCSFEHEELQDFATGDSYNEAPQKCPKCGEVKKQTRLIAATTFNLSGRNWFRDSYGK